MAYLHFDRTYAPCSVLIVRDGGDPYNENDAILIQGEDAMHEVAEHLGLRSNRMDASDILLNIAGDAFNALDDYFVVRGDTEIWDDYRHDALIAVTPNS